MIWVALALLVGTGLGVLMMCVFNVSSDGDRYFILERRALDLAIALRELLGTVRACQGGTCDVNVLGDALARADDVLDNRTADGEDREMRVLVLRMALRRLLAAAQSYIESGEGFDILAVAMSHAAEVLTLNGEQCAAGMER